jgi:hypothetical protein
VLRRQQGWGKAVNNLARHGRAWSTDLASPLLSTGGLEWRDREATSIDVLVTGFPQPSSRRKFQVHREDASSIGRGLTGSLGIQLLLLD